MDRDQIIDEFFRGRQKTTVDYYQFLTKPREYIPGLTLYMRELDFLTMIKKMGNPAITELAEQLGVTHSAVSQIGTRLIKKGLILRQKNENDQRSNVVSLTPLGEQVCEIDKRINNLVRETLASMASNYSNEDILRLTEADKIMRKVLTKYNDFMEGFLSDRK